jgi:hypothetical protein
VSLILRRLLNYLPHPPGRSDRLYVRSSWHKPTPYDQWRSQAPFRARPGLRTDHFGRELRRRRLVRGLIRWMIALALVWIVWESIRAVA